MTSRTAGETVRDRYRGCWGRRIR